MNKIPSVFISYSYDSNELKRWVAKLSTELVNNGIDVMLDQWDTVLGDDLSKYMYNSIKKVDRVLIICTNKYVLKANEGEGGVGYETTIVTGELVKNIGTSKFIPVIKQETKNIELPNYMGNRKYIDFSNEDNYSIKFDELIREIHNKPILKKPEIGRNPFYNEKEINEIDENIKLDEIINIQNNEENLNEIYQIAIKIAVKSDIYSWRKLISKIRKDYSNELHNWHQNFASKKPNNKDEIYQNIYKIVKLYEPLICVGIAGIESNNKLFNEQFSILDDMIYIKNWNINGYTVYTNVNMTIAYIYQAIYGTVAIYTKQAELAFKMINQIVDIGKRKKLWQDSRLIGWPDSFLGNSEEAWIQLKDIYNKWSWLKNIFINKDDYITSLCAYYMLINLNEYMDLNKNGTNINKVTNIIVETPVEFIIENDYIKQAYRLVLSNSEIIMKEMEINGLTYEQLEIGWEKWVDLLYKNVNRPFLFFTDSGIYKSLIKDIFNIT